MEHTLLDFLKLIDKEGGEKDLVTSPPGELSNNILTIHHLLMMIDKNFNPKLCNEVTITFKDSIIIPFKVEYIHNRVNDFLRRWSKVANYVLVQDYSQTGRLHYHGILEMNQIDKFERLIINLRKTFGRIECKQISFWDSYLHYMVGLYDPNHEKFMDAIKFSKERVMSNKIII